jgi:hyperosmotically inducible protein
MKTQLATTCVLFGAFLGVSIAAVAQDSDRSHPTTFVADSIVTTMIKMKLATAHPPSLEHIHVVTDEDGVVWLSGHTSSQAAAAKAVAIARATERVRVVYSEIKIERYDSAYATQAPAQQGKPPQAGDRGVEQGVGLALALALLSGTGVAPTH